MRHSVLSIAGYDPSGGAGVLADMKTAEALGAHGVAAITALTYQHDESFLGLDWVSTAQIIRQCEPLFERYNICAVKIGLIPNLETLETLVDLVRSKSKTLPLVWDPILTSSTGFTFHQSLDRPKLLSILPRLSLITPNLPEMIGLSSSADPAVKELSLHCPILLKGGHAEEKASPTVNDCLFIAGEETVISTPRIPGTGKHGTGCVFSTASAVYLAQGHPLAEAVTLSQQYTRNYISSAPGRVGFHVFSKHMD